MRQLVGIIGAGTSGLAVAKNLKQHGIAFECLEREEQLGGNWCYGSPASSIFKSTCLISSAEQTEYTDFPMPEDYPPYPGHKQVFSYIQAYADKFDLRRDIQFCAGVKRAVRSEDGGWDLTLESGRDQHYDQLVIANGHNWDPRYPEFKGEFQGLEIHSSEYKTPDLLRGRGVLVVGGGNSGCDIAVESTAHAQKTYLSLRRGYHILPKFFHGTPIDVCGERALRWRAPLFIRRLYASLILFLTQGNSQTAGFPKPDHRLFETHPVINSKIIDAARHGDLRIAANVGELCGRRVRFEDGTESEFDIIIYATGFKVSFPFMDREELNWRDGCPRLYLNVFHPECDDLFFSGLIQPDSGQFGLVDLQAMCIARYIDGLRKKRASCLRFKERKRRVLPPVGGGVRYVDSPRHLLEVEHFSYRKQLKRLYRRLRK